MWWWAWWTMPGNASPLFDFPLLYDATFTKRQLKVFELDGTFEFVAYTQSSFDWQWCKTIMASNRKILRRHQCHVAFWSWGSLRNLLCLCSLLHKQNNVMDDANSSWYGMVWYGSKNRSRYDMVRYGMICDMVWYGMVWMQTDHGGLPLHPRATQVLRPNPPTHHLTVNQRCRCTLAKNQLQTNDWKLAASAFAFMVRLLWLENLAFGGFAFLAGMKFGSGRIQPFYLKQMNMKFRTRDWIIIQSFDLIGDN